MINTNVVQATSNYSEPDSQQKSVVGRLSIIIDDKIINGTIFHIGNGICLTAGHCFKNLSHGNIINNSFVEFSIGVPQQQLRTLINEIILIDVNLDLAVLRLAIVPTQALKLSPKDCANGEDVFMIHYPQGGNIKKSDNGVATIMDFGRGDGEVGNIAMYEGSEYFRSTCTTEPGSSGAPIFSLQDSNKVIGIHVRGDGRGTQNIHAAIKISEIKKKLEICLTPRTKRAVLLI